MVYKEIHLKDEIFLIADVHYKKENRKFILLLKELLLSPPKQVFFLGDIFHLLLPFKFLYNYNKEAIELINSLSNKTEVYYTYGNHDFNIATFFPNVVFADVFVDKKRSILLTHGDLLERDFIYYLYSRIIRNRLFLDFLNIVSFNFVNGYLFKKILNKRVKCNKIDDFYEKILLKYEKFDYNLIIEGHYHQGVDFKNYINVPAFFCDNSYVLLKLDNNILKEVKYDR